MTARYIHDYDKFREFLNSDFIADAMRVRAEAVKRAAETMAPVGAGRDGGHYKDHFKVQVDRWSAAKHNRVQVSVVNDHAHAADIELGHHQDGKPVPGAHTLTKALHVLDGSGTSRQKGGVKGIG